jgi:hypothetical protein
MGKQKERNVLIQTVTHYYTGRVVAEYESEFVLDNAAWIADTGRFSNFLASGIANEVEPIPDGTLVSINRGAIVAVLTWGHALPRVTK